MGNNTINIIKINNHLSHKLTEHNKNPGYMMLEIWTLAWDRYTNVAGLNQLLWYQPSLGDNYTPTHREGAILQSPCPSVHTFVTDISASTGRNDFIFDIWLWHGNLYRVSPFQVYRTSTSCLQCDLEFFMFAVMKTFVTVISVSTGRNDFIFDIWLWHGDLYRVSPFQVYRTSTSCLPCDLQMNEWGYS